MKLDKKFIRRPKKDNIKLRKNDDEFMKDLGNQNKAEIMLQHRVDSKNWTKEEFVEHAQRRGFLKTETDRQIVESIMIKKNMKNMSLAEASARQKEQARRIQQTPRLAFGPAVAGKHGRESQKKYKKFY